MKVILINGSPRKEGNTATALNLIVNELKNHGVETETIHVGAEAIHGCIGCGYCRTSKDNMCVYGGDMLNEILPKIREADGLIIGSPVYYSGVAGTMKCFLDRLFYTSSVYFRFKPAAAVCAVRRSGGTFAFQQLNNYLNLGQMLIVPSTYWNVIHGRAEKEALHDGEGVQTLQTLAKNMAWLLKVVAQTNVEKPAPDKKVFTNFVR